MGRPKKFSRDEVLEKAIPVFWKHGFADTSLQDLERATQVNKSGLYAEFASKEELFLASLRYYLDNRGGKKVLSTEPLGWHNIENFLKLGQVRMWGQKGCFAICSMREFAVLPSEALKIVKENRATIKRLLIKNIQAESTTLDATEIAQIVATFFSGFCLEQNIEPSPDASTRKINDLMRMIRSL